METDPNYAWGYIALGGAHLANSDAGSAVTAVHQALTLEPNGYEANLFMGFYLQYAGESELAIEHLLLAKRLSPVVTLRDLAFLLLAQFTHGNYSEVVRIYTEVTDNFPHNVIPGIWVSAAAAYALLDRPDKSTEVVNSLLDAHPLFNLSQFKGLDSWKLEENRTRLYNAAIKAGVPEFPTE